MNMAKRKSLQRQTLTPGSSNRRRVQQANTSIINSSVSTTTESNRAGKSVTTETESELPDDAHLSDEEGGTRIGDIYIPPPIPPHCSTESKGPRLIIKKIENNNFKSYAGKVVLGPFHHCFTAIIGPNGSGKSNVIDSMLFVFGYRANKIRCKKISTLLHNSAKFPNMSMCSVAVHFRQIIDREDGSCDEVPNSDIVIERTAYRDNSSFYTINGKRVQFKEVAKLLKEHHVDLDHNRFLILQGEVESIAMMKPKGQNENECGMLEYLEDIVGTTRYIAPLIKINERVDQLTEERTEKHNRCKLAEREMKDLEQPYNEAVEYLRRENENTRTKNLRIQKYLSEKNKKLEEYNKEHELISDELRKHDEATEVLKKERLAKEQLVRAERAAFDELQKKKDGTEKKLEKANSKYTEVQETMSITNKRRKQNKNQLEKLGDDLEALRKVPSKNENEILECEKKVEKLTQQKSNLEDELQKNYALLEDQMKPIIEERDKLQTELIELKKNVDEDKAKLAVSESELRILKYDETTEARKYETLKTSYEESQSSLQEKQQTVSEMKKLLPEMQLEVAAETKQLQELQQEEEILGTKLTTVRAEINEKMASMNTAHSNNKVLNFLMRQKNEGKLPGILGRLGDLGAIDAKYDVAISTACGRLDNIVVDTFDTAEECVEYLRRFDVGVASFIALDKIKHLANQSGPIQTPENAARLYDLVRVEDERVLPAFYFSLRNTLVAADLEQGTRIAYGARRYRVVTLNGDVIETSGTMSGGGRTQRRGKMGTKVQMKTKQSAESSLVTQKALEDMQEQAQELQSKINYNQEEQGRLESHLQQLNVNRQKHEIDLQKLTITIKSLVEQLPRIFKQLENQKERMQKTTTDEVKVKSIEAEITQQQATLKQSEEAAGKKEQKIADVKAQIDSLHGDKVKSVQTKINNLTTQIKKLDNNSSKLKVEVKTAERNATKTENQIEQLKAEILKAQDELTALSVDRQKYDDEIGQLDVELKEAQAAIDNAKSESSGIQKEIIELQKQESDNKLKRIEIEQKLQTVAAKLNDVKAQIPHWRDQLKPLRLHEIPGDSEPQVPLKTYTEEELASHTLQDIQYKESVQEELLKKKPNLSCIREYIDKRDVYLERVKVLEDITSKRNEMRQLYDDVRKKRYNEFMQGFHIITRKLKEMYQMITQGGDAELELVDSMDPFTEGVSFSVRPPKKTWKNISNLSGGEKTLSSLALVFALHYYKPSPLYFMDEIDAALDFKNISIVAHYIKERTKNAQFIIISLRSNMFELSDYIVGIYKVIDCTDSVTIKNKPPPSPQSLVQTQSQNQVMPTTQAGTNVFEIADETLPTETQPIMLTQTQVPPIIITTAASPSTPPPSPPLPPPLTESTKDNRLTNADDVDIMSGSSRLTQSQGSRDTTFKPTAESTTLSQNLQIDLSSTNTTLKLPNNSINNDAFFKKPLPPPDAQ